MSAEPEIDVDIDVFPPIAYSIIRPREAWRTVIRVGWANCGACGKPVLDCRCPHLVEPAHVRKMREKEEDDGR